MIGLIARLSLLVVGGALLGAGNITLALLGIGLMCWVAVTIPKWVDKLNAKAVPQTAEQVKAEHEAYRARRKPPVDSKWHDA